MKKLIVALLLICSLFAACTALADEGADIPAELHALIAQSDRWNGWTATDCLCPADGQYAFVAMHKDATNELLYFSRASGQWKLSWHQHGALPQGSDVLQLNDRSHSTYAGLSLGTAISFRLATPGEWESIYELRDNVWRLREIVHCDTDGSQDERFVIKDDHVLYYSRRTGRETRIDGVVQTDLRYFAYSSFSKDPDVLRKSLSNPPAIPAGTLTAREVQFTGGRKYSVYQGPDEGYGQAGNGKAAVSTNDWIQVFGQEDGWIMIQYDITSDHMRIGWINAAALPKDAAVPTLTWQAQSAWLSKTAALTDDPLFTQSAILTLPEGAWVTVLGTLGDWAYVESSTGDLLRGFIRQDALRYDRVFHIADHSEQKAAGTMTLSPQRYLTLDMTIAAANQPYAFLLRDELNGRDIGTALRQPQGGYPLEAILPAEVTSVSFIPVTADGSRGEELFRIEW